MSLLIPVFALLGLFVGSFANVCIDRLPLGQSIISPSSHCSACKRRLSIFDLIPVFSYLWLRGRCRYCRAPIPLRIPIVEGVTGLMFALLYWRFGLGLELGISLVYATMLIIIFVIDLEHQLVLNKITYPGMALAFIFAFFWPGLGVIGSLGEGALGRAVSSLAGGALAAGALGLVVIVPLLVFHRPAMGMGDVKLGALVGLMNGFPLVIVTLFLAVVTGGLVAAILLILRIKRLGERLPFATFLAASAMVTLLWGQAIWEWYLSINTLLWTQVIWGRYL